MRRELGVVFLLSLSAGCTSAAKPGTTAGHVWTDVTCESSGVEVLDPWVHARRPGESAPAAVSPALSIVEGRPWTKETVRAGAWNDAGGERSLVTAHFHVTSDGESAALAGYGRDLERAWAAYEESFGAAPGGPRIEARILASAGTYAAILEERHEPWLPGFYEASTHTLYVHVMDDGPIAAIADRSVLCHEAFHAFADRALPNLPAWLGEGLATREAFDLVGIAPVAYGWRNALELELRRRRPDLRPYSGRIGWGELFAASLAQFHDTAEQARVGARTNRESSAYVLSWSLLALAKADPEGAAAALVAATLDRVRHGEAPSVPFSEAALDGEWRLFVARLLDAPVRPLDRRSGLALSERDVRRASERRLVATQRSHAAALEIASRIQGDDLVASAAGVAACYDLGERDVGWDLARRTGVRSFEGACGLASIDCFYSRASHGLVVTVRRKEGVVGPLAFAFPPGTNAWAEASADDFDAAHVSRVQDLALLRAPVLVLGAEENAVSVSVPVARATFSRSSPRDRQVMTLARFDPDSPVDRLVVALCSGELASGPDAQLALWLATNDLAWKTFRDEGGERGFVRTLAGEPVLPANAEGAAQLLLEGAVDPRDASFFRP